MKKLLKSVIFFSVLSCIFTGCFNDSNKYTFDEATPEDFVQRVTTDMEQKYNEKFEVVDYIIPSYIAGLSNPLDKNIILAKSSEGLYITFKSSTSNSDDLYDNYRNKKMEVVYQDIIDFQGLDCFEIISNYKTDNFSLNLNDVNSICVQFDVWDIPSEDTLLKVYNIRNEFINKGIKMENLAIVFRGHSDIKEEHPESYFIYNEWLQEKNAYKWCEILDENVLNSNELTFTEFKKAMNYE